MWQPGPALAGPGFLNPCVSDTVSIHQGGRTRNTDYGLICKQDLHVSAGEIHALPSEPPCSEWAERIHPPKAQGSASLVQG